MKILLGIFLCVIGAMMLLGFGFHAVGAILGGIAGLFGAAIAVVVGLIGGIVGLIGGAIGLIVGLAVPLLIIGVIVMAFVGLIKAIAF